MIAQTIAAVALIVETIGTLKVDDKGIHRSLILRQVCARATRTFSSSVVRSKFLESSERPSPISRSCCSISSILASEAFHFFSQTKVSDAISPTSLLASDRSRKTPARSVNALICFFGVVASTICLYHESWYIPTQIRLKGRDDSNGYSDCPLNGSVF